MFYVVGLVMVHVLYDDRATHAQPADGADTSPVTFRDVLAFRNFILMMGVIFGLQFVDRSFGPVLPLYVEQVGVAHARVPIVAGVLFSVMAFTGALGHHFCGKLLRHYASRTVIAGGAAVAALGCGLFGLSGNFWVMASASVVLGLGIGAAMTASYSAAGTVIPPGAHGAGFGVLTSASLVGMASSPFIAGFVGGASIRIVFFIDLAMMALLAVVVRRTMSQD
jgi:MFS family permease